MQHPGQSRVAVTDLHAPHAGRAVDQAVARAVANIDAIAACDDLPLFATNAPVMAEPKISAVEEELRKFSPDTLTPREALERLYALKGLLRDQK